MRGDVIFNNMPQIRGCAFRILLGEGLEFVPYRGTNYLSNYGDGMYGLRTFNPFNNNHGLTFVYASTEDEDWDGCMFSFYVEPTDSYLPTNSSAYIDFGNNYGYLENSSGRFYGPPTISTGVDLPVISETGEFMYGDANDSGNVDGSDTTKIQSAITENGGPIDLSAFSEGDLTALPSYKTAFAADVDNDGYITSNDASAVLSYYVIVGSGLTYTGNIGTTDIYEIY